ncbi:MAG: Zn-dependent hydrolase [Acetobacter sp.]|uniref:Zn-dependent hydrolase n=1 Tax=Acetobacter sp. TaxID=440 RepID=UPI0039EC4AAB
MALPAVLPVGVPAALPISPQRLDASVQEFGRVGALPGGEVARLALTDADRAGRDLLVARMRALGLSVSVDAIGNIFGTRAGDGGTQGTVMVGSHIDTVSTGGLYDGTFGVLAGLEVVATLNDMGARTRHPITIAAFTNEEGARFQPDMLGSLVFAGGLALDEALALRDADGAVLGDELRRIGYAGQDRGPADMTAYFELHIEQGPVLEREGVQIGVVSGVQGISWHEITVRGRSAHAGTTPMAMRHDAGHAAARIVCGAHDMARTLGPDQLVATGYTRLTPNLVNVIAQEAVFTVDLRNPDNAALQQADAALLGIAQDVATQTGTDVTCRTLARFDPVAFDPACVNAVEHTARALGYSTRRLHSGAGHDAQMIARIAPSAMIFVPSVGGISHNVREFTALDDLVRGTVVLARLVADHAGATPA